MTKSRPDGSGFRGWNLRSRQPDDEDYRLAGMVDEARGDEFDASLNEDVVDSDRADRKAAIDGSVGDDV